MIVTRSRSTVVAALATAALGSLLLPANGSLAAPRAVAPAAAVARPTSYFALQGGRLGQFSTATGQRQRWLSPAGQVVDDPRVTLDRSAVLYSANGGCGPLTKVVLATGATTTLRSGGAGGGSPIAVGKGAALAGFTCGVATSAEIATDAAGVAHGIIGTRTTGARQASFAPTGGTLALSGFVDTIYLVPLIGDTPFLDPASTVPCPAQLPGCHTQVPGYLRDGRLYFVATAANGSAAWLSRYNPATKGVGVVLKLPQVTGIVHLSTTPAGAVLVTGAVNDAATTSSYVLSWDGVTARRLPTGTVQASW